jgi:hypothetical protein
MLPWRLPGFHTIEVHRIASLRGSYWITTPSPNRTRQDYSSLRLPRGMKEILRPRLASEVKCTCPPWHLQTYPTFLKLEFLGQSCCAGRTDMIVGTLDAESYVLPWRICFWGPWRATSRKSWRHDQICHIFTNIGISLSSVRIDMKLDPLDSLGFDLVDCVLQIWFC